MKKYLMLIIIISSILSTATLYAAEKAPLGVGNLAVKFDYIHFTDGDLKDADVNSGFYVGVEGYYMIVPALYLGAEVGYTGPDGKIGSVLEKKQAASCRFP
jgi:hypothetical protein